MKKKLCLFIALALTIISCSNDDNSSSENNLILPKKISYTYPDSPDENYESIITYDGNKIKSINDVSTIRKFIYDGNLIVKQLKFAVDSQGKETKIRETNYTYANGKLVSKIFALSFSETEPNGSYSSKTVYTHNTDGTISYIQYLPNSTDIDYKAILIYDNKNLIKREISFINDPNYEKEIDAYEYDSKNNPLKNILGFDLLIEEISDFGNNNILKMTRTTNNEPSSVVVQGNYLYNENNYPLKNNSKINIQSNRSDKNIEYTY